jgi:hypothetical protein
MLTEDVEMISEPSSFKAANLASSRNQQVWSKPEGLDETFMTKDLDKDLRLFSKANGDVLDLLLQTKRPGWILFGLSEMGSTKGTDLMLARVEGMDVYTHDLFTENGEAQADTCGNEWKAVKGSTSNGETILHLQRPLNGQSKIEDRDISCGSYEHLLFEVGAAELPHSKENALKAANQMLAGIRKKHDENKFTYGTADTVLCGKDPLDSVNAAEKIDLLQNVLIPKNHTTIMCHGFTLKGDGHIVAMMPVITSGSPVHHFHLHRCRNNKFFREFDNNPHPCAPPSFGDHQRVTKCVGSAYTYLAGQSGPFVLPPEAGIVIGDDVDNGELRHLILEIHYDNPMHLTGKHDESGLRIWREHVPRKYAAALIGLGDPFAELYGEWNKNEHDKAKKKGVPPGKPNYEITVCRSNGFGDSLIMPHAAEATHA